MTTDTPVAVAEGANVMRLNSPKRSSHKGIAWRARRGRSKVGQLDHALLCQKDIAGLDVTMNTIVAMQVL